MNKRGRGRRNCTRSRIHDERGDRNDRSGLNDEINETNEQLDLINISNAESINNTMSGGSMAPIGLKNSAGIFIPKSFPQVGVVTNHLLQTTPLESFVWLEKTDGLHSNIAIANNSIYVYKHGKPEEVEKLDIQTKGQSILDTELYKGKYYVFDASMIEGIDISQSHYIERMEAAKIFLSNYSSVLSKYFVLKSYSKIQSIQFLLDFINKNSISPETHNKIDGVVLQRIDQPYIDKTCFKLKRKVMNTIDFKIFYEEYSKVFYLYLYGTFLDVVRNKKLLPRINKYSKKHTTVNLNTNQLPSKLYVLFSSPYRENLHIFKPREVWDTNGYFEDDINEINDLMNKILKDPKLYNGRIIEMSLADDGWVPMRKRDDKLNANNYNIGLSNVSVIFDPIIPDYSNTYFSKTFAFDSSIISPYHDVNKLIRKYIVERSINPLKSKITVLDLAGGRGADELNLYHSGASLIFAADSDREALVQYVERTDNTITAPHSFLLPSSKEIIGLPKSILINAIYANLGEDNTEIINEIKGRFEYPKEGFDIILMNYAIHYLCHKKSNIIALRELINSLLKPNGLFIFSCFDGDYIIEDIKEKGKNDSLEFKSFEIKLIKPQIESDADAVWANMPLPTIDASGYRPEPLAKSEYLNLLDMEEIEDYFPTDDLERNITEIENYEKVADYLSYIHVHVMKRKT